MRGTLGAHRADRIDAATQLRFEVNRPAGERVEVVGPETLGVDEWARRLFALTGDDRTVVGNPQTRFFGTTLSGGELTISDGARIGAYFETWLVTAELGVSGGPAER